MKKLFIHYSLFLVLFGSFVVLGIIYQEASLTSLKNDINASNGDGTTYYISSSTGNDTNNGLSPATAWQSFANINANFTIINQEPIIDDGNPVLYDNGSQCYTWYENTTQGDVTLNPGDSILLFRGDVWQEQLRLNAKGNTTHPITLSAYGVGEKPLIRLDGFEYQECIVLDDPSFWRISDIDLRSAKIGLYLRYWDDYWNDDVRIFNCHFQDIYSLEWERTWEHNFEYSWSCGIFVGGKIETQQHAPVIDNLLVRNSTFQNCTVAFGDNWYWPEVNRSRLRNLILENCTIQGGQQGMMLNFVDGGHARYFHTLNGGGHYSCGVAGGFAQSCQNFVIEKSIFANIKRDLCPDGVGFDYEGDNRNMTFRNNAVFNNDGAGILVMSTVSTNIDIAIENCLFYNNCRNPYSDEVSYELLCYDETTTGSLKNVRIDIGDDWNRVTKEYGITIAEIDDNPEEYTVKYFSEKWFAFNSVLNVDMQVMDDDLDYSSLWPFEKCIWCDGVNDSRIGLEFGIGINFAFISIILITFLIIKGNKK